MKKKFYKTSFKEKAKAILLCSMLPLVWVIDRVMDVGNSQNINRRKALAGFLAFTMLLTTLPMMSLTVEAEPAIEPTPLTFTAETAGSTVTLNYVDGSDVKYQTGNDGWADYTKGTAITLENLGDTVSFNGNGVTTNSGNHFSMSGKIAASGDVTSLTNGVGGDATLTANCYPYMFYGCTSLTTAPALPSTVLANYCYYYMFSGCTSLEAAPTLPATTMTRYCYSYMFRGCTSLEAAPALTATTLAANCYFNMFNDCTSLKVAPVLPATALASSCYSSMFRNCTSLTATPELRTTALETSCYYGMFFGCTSLEAAPILPATTMATSCYNSMFSGCTSLKVAPELPATTLANDCYSYMFNGCRSLKISTTQTGEYTKEWIIPSTGTISTTLTGWNNGMLTGTGGPFTDNPSLNTTYYLYQDPAIPLTFTAQTAGSTITLNYKSGSDVKYRLGSDEWTDYRKGTEITLDNANDTISFRGSDVVTDYNNYFTMTGKLAASGDVTSLTNGVGGDATLSSSCYYNMFRDCTSLTTAPELPATTLATNCYNGMFYGCTSLKVSNTQTGNYNKQWRIPTTGTITVEASGWNTDMLAGTGGTFTSNPSENTIYYIYVDTTAPVISGIEDSKTYCQTAEFTVTDEDLDTVTVNDSTLTAVNGTYTLTAVGTNTIVATDKSGNRITVSVTINADHTWKEELFNDDTNHWHECSVCGEKEDKAAHTPNADDGDCTTAICCSVCGAVTTAAKSHDFSGDYDGHDNTQHWHICNNEGCDEIDAKEAHTGGTADYFHKAVCSVCGQEYGSTTPDVTAPTNLKIQYNNNGFKSFLNTITFGIFFKETVTVTASAEDSESGVASYKYFASDEKINDFTSVSWQNSLSLSPNSKKIVYVKATDNAGNESIVNYEGVVVYSNSSVSPNTATFDKNVDEQADVVFTMTLNDNTLKDIKNGSTVLTSGTDYTVSGTTVTVKKAYFAAQENGNVTLTFSFYPMGVENNDNLSTSTATVTVSDTTHYHDMSHTAAVAPTCTTNGNVEYWYCSGCDKYFSDEDGDTEITNTVVSKLGHYMSHTSAVAATCTTDGNVEYWHCATCNKYFTDANGNNETTLANTVVSKLGHDMSHTSAVAPTCTTDGNVEYWHCATCNKYFSDEDGDTEITNTVVSKLGHDMDHTSAVAPTCTTDGNVEYWYCSGCNKYFSDADGDTEITNTVVSKLGHDMSHTSAVAATCTTDGNVEYWHCATCDKYFTDANGNNETTLANTVTNALGHSFTSYAYNNDATYYNDGTETATCNHDGCSVTDTRTKSGTKLIDTTAPTGEIKINNNSFKSFVNSISFGLFFKESQTVTITGEDAGIGMDKIYYYKSETALTLDEVNALSSDKWTVYSTLTLSPDWQGVVYGKLTDKSGNTLYISSDGLVLDATSPVIAGITDGSQYCNTATVQVTVTEANLDSVTLDGETVTLENGKFIVSAKDDAQKIVVTDKAGNVTSATITVYDEHIWDDGVVTKEPTVTEMGAKIYTCTICGETKTEEIDKLAPSIIDGKNGTYKQGDKNGLTFKSNASLADFISVSVDGKVIDNTNYTLKEGSTIVTLKADYLETLYVGKHTLEINSNSGTASTEFTIEEKTANSVKENNNSKPGDKESPKTGDASDMIMWLALLFVSGGALTTLGVTKKRKKANNK